MPEPAFRNMVRDEFRRTQKKALQDPSQKPIAVFVRALRRINPTVPHVAPTYGGTRARILLLLSDPGPMTQEGEQQGSGFISHENNDNTAARLAHCLWRAGLLDKSAEPPGSHAPEVIGWNAYPWLVERGPDNRIRKPDPDELEAGAAVLDRFLGLLPHLTVVVLMGRVAEEGWNALVSKGGSGYQQFIARGVRDPLYSCHPSDLGSRHGHWNGEIIKVLKRAKNLAAKDAQKK